MHPNPKVCAQQQNRVRKQVRDNAAQLMRIQHRWELELEAGRCEAEISFAEQLEMKLERFVACELRCYCFCWCMYTFFRTVC